MDMDAELYWTTLAFIQVMLTYSGGETDAAWLLFECIENDMDVWYVYDDVSDDCGYTGEKEDECQCLNCLTW